MAELSSDEARVLDSLDELTLVGSLVELIRIPSITGTAAESDLQHRQAAELTRYGFEVDTWQLDLGVLRADPRFPGAEAERTEGTASSRRRRGRRGSVRRPWCCRAMSTSSRPEISPSGSATIRSVALSLQRFCMDGGPAI